MKSSHHVLAVLGAFLFSASPALALPISDPLSSGGTLYKVPENPPPPTPPTPGVTNTPRAADRLTVTWNGTLNTGDQAQLQHLDGTTWTGLTALNAGFNSFTHTGLATDSQHCYRVRAFNAYGTRYSPQMCGYTSDGTTRRVWRAQIEFHTASVDDANTDDSVSVQLNGTSGSPSGNLTWVDYGRDDFERGDIFTYDLVLDGVTFLSDITQIHIAKTGDDGWCLADFKLIVNGVAVYSESLATSTSPCRWLDTEGGAIPSYSVNHDTLRAHPSWQAYIEPLRATLDTSRYPAVTATIRIPRAETESRVESLIGDMIHGTEAKWGHEYGRAYVEATQSGFPHTVHIDLDLEAEVPYWFNPELDIDFDLQYDAACSTDGTEAVVTIRAERAVAAVDFDWFTEFLSFILPCGPIVSEIEQQGIPDCITALEEYLGSRIQAGFEPIVKSQRQALPAGYTCLSADVAVDANANVDLIFQVQAPTTVLSRFGVVSTRSLLLQ
jgi:hypothetical protein